MQLTLLINSTTLCRFPLFSQVHNLLGKGATVLVMVGSLDEFHLHCFQLLVELINGWSLRILDYLHDVSFNLLTG